MIHRAFKSQRNVFGQISIKARNSKGLQKTKKDSLVTLQLYRLNYI